jgi:hypothetical protein
MLLTRKQIEQMYNALDKYPEATEVVLLDRGNSSGIGPDTIAQFQDRGNIFRQIAPKVYGEEDITDVGTW